MEGAKTKVEYVLFDMDGLLLDSERVYTEVTNTILGRYGFEMNWDIKSQLMGKPERVSAELLWALLPGIEKHLSVDDYITERRRLQDLQWPHVSLLPGAAKLVRHLHAHSIPMAVATGSLRRNFLLKTADEKCSKEKVEVFQLFGQNLMCGDDGPTGKSIWGTERVVRGKPAPDIFLCAAEMIGRNVGREELDILEEQKAERKKGLVFEDGIPGVEAASRAGMQVVWVPDANLLALDPKLDVSKISTLEDFVPEEWGLPPYNADPPR